MKKFGLLTAAMLFVTFVSSAHLHAQSSVNISTGSFLEAAGSFGVGDGVLFQFSAPGTAGSQPYFFSGTGGDHSGFQSCTVSGCTAATIAQIGKSVPLQLAPPGGLFGFGGAPAYCWNGGGTFNYTSGFSYQVKSGVLTAQGVVTPSVSFTPADPTTCTPNGLPTFVVTGQWRYVAKFARQNGMYYLTQLQFDPLP